jgi:hypothetical protein
LKTVVLGVGLGRGLFVQTTDLDEGGRLLSVGSTDIFEMLAESERVIENGCHTTDVLTMEDYATMRRTAPRVYIGCLHHEYGGRLAKISPPLTQAVAHTVELRDNREVKVRTSLFGKRGPHCHLPLSRPSHRTDTTPIRPSPTLITPRSVA